MEYLKILPEWEQGVIFGKIEEKVEAYKSRQSIFNEEFAEDEFVLMKIYDEYAAAGIGSYFNDDNSGYIEMRFNKAELPPRADFGVRISGDSMMPDIEDGCVVWVKPQPQIESGQVGIFILDGQPLCKKLKIDYGKKGGRTAHLISTNPEYDPIEIDENSDIRTVGLVLSSFWLPD